MVRKRLSKKPQGLTRRDGLLVLLGVLLVAWVWSALHTSPEDIEAKLSESLSKNKTINAINYSKVQREKENERLNKEFEPI